MLNTSDGSSPDGLALLLFVRPPMVPLHQQERAVRGLRGEFSRYIHQHSRFSDTKILVSKYDPPPADRSGHVSLGIHLHSFPSGGAIRKNGVVALVHGKPGGVWPDGNRESYIRCDCTGPTQVGEEVFLPVGL